MGATTTSRSVRRSGSVGPVRSLRTAMIGPAAAQASAQSPPGPSGAHPGTWLAPDASSSAVSGHGCRARLSAQSGTATGYVWMLVVAAKRGSTGWLSQAVTVVIGGVVPEPEPPRFARLGSGDIQPSLCGIGAGAGNVGGAIQRLQELGSCVSPDDGSRPLFIVCSRLWLIGAAGGSVVRGHARVGSLRWLATATSGTRACPEMVCFRG